MAVGGLVDEVDANALFGSTFLLLGELPQGLAVLVRERVDGSPGLGNEDCKLIGPYDRVAITILAGKIDFDWDMGHSLQHELSYNAGMSAGAAG